MVIAEIGVNHDGRLDRALKLVQMAHRCGADAVKLQIFKANQLVHSSAPLAEYQKSNGKASSSQLLKDLELSQSELEKVVSEIRKLGMIPLATPFSVEDVETVEELGLGVIKIASPDLVNWPLLRRAAGSDRPLLISTGAASMDEVLMAAGWLNRWESEFALLHCISSYPTPTDQANLCWIGELHEQCNVPVGYSDHTQETAAGAMAVAAGACIVEKHITYDCGAAGPDHSASADAEQFSQYVSMIRLADRMAGSGRKHVLDIEKDVRHVSRQSLVARRELQIGQRITEWDLMVKRPGTGIPAAQLRRIVGKTVGKRIRAGELISWQALRSDSGQALADAA
jgi:N-acetylneuraminate synthase/N,N'-diacetyllegionaminate synthase